MTFLRLLQPFTHRRANPPIDTEGLATAAAVWHRDQGQQRSDGSLWATESDETSDWMSEKYVLLNG